MKVLVLWIFASVLFFLALAIGACGAAQKASEPAPVNEPAWCYAAVVGGVETIGCAAEKATCDASRAALAEADAVSEDCYQVQLRLDRANP